MFGMKFHRIGVVMDETYSMESNRSQSGGFSFISIVALSDELLQKYYLALDKHLLAVKKGYKL